MQDDARITLKLLDDLLGGPAGDRVGVRLWDGTRWPDDRPRDATLVLRHPGALRAMFRAGTELALSEAYLHDDFDIEGDILAVHGLGGFQPGPLIVVDGLQFAGPGHLGIELPRAMGQIGLGGLLFLLLYLKSDIRRIDKTPEPAA